MLAIDFGNWLEICFLSLVSSIRVVHLACVLIGSLAKLLSSFCKQSVLVLHRSLMLLLAMWSHQWLSTGLLKSIVIPNSFMVSYQEWGHVAAYYPCCTQPHQVLNRTFCYQSLVVFDRFRFWIEPLLSESWCTQLLQILNRTFHYQSLSYSNTSGSELNIFAIRVVPYSNTSGSEYILLSSE